MTSYRCGEWFCTFTTPDALWFESHQARHLLDGRCNAPQRVAAPEPSKRDHDLSHMSPDELTRTRRQLEASLTFARPGSPVSVPIMAQIRAIDTLLGNCGGTR